MFYSYLSESIIVWIALLGLVLTVLGIHFGKRYLPKDQGRQFAVNGALSQGKPRGAGLVLVLAFTAACLLCIPFSVELLLYLVAIFVECMSGYLDDASEKPWGELKKGLIDLFCALLISVTVWYYHGTSVYIPFTEIVWNPPVWLYILLGVILVWVSINVTNCSDGVDGLCASLSIVTLTTVFMTSLMVWISFDTSTYMVWAMIFVLCGYLWFNCSPSKLLMGDAGSRAIGLLIALAFMVSGIPFLYIPGALLLIIDGGLGLVKLTVLRTLKVKSFMQNIRTPIHDHARKNHSWSDTQVVTRFTLLQMVLSLFTVLLLLTKWAAYL